MKDSILKRFSIAAMLFLVILMVAGLADRSHAAGFQGGVPLQVGDVVICFGSGTCNVLRISGSTATLLDQFSDNLLGDTRGVALDNTLHAVVTDNAGGGASDVVVYTIASLNPNTNPPSAIAHSVLPNTPFNASGGANSANAQAVVVNKFGHIFVGNSGNGTPAPDIVELNPDGSLANAFPTGSLFTNPLPLTGCADIAGQLLSLDLSKDGLSIYLTTSNTTYQNTTSNGGHIQKITLSTGNCAPFASFGPGVALNGIQDVPPGALAGVTPNCKGTPCPTTRDTILVVAEGFFDSDGDPGIEPSSIPDSGDDVNICTNAIGGAGLVSCALLLDTGVPGLTASPWLAGTPYLTTGVKVLDANLHVQQVATAGTSGTYATNPFHPAWKTDGTTTIDNRVTWQDEGHCGLVGDPFPSCPAGIWSANTVYAMGAQIRDPASHVQQVTVAGTSGSADSSLVPAQPVGGWNDFGGMTFDGLTWTDLGTSVVARYPVTSVSTLQALALDALVSDCSTGGCSSSVPAPQVSKFWLGDNGSANFYKLDFATGTSTMYTANANTAGGPCGTCTSALHVQGVRIYGGEGANQADLTKLASGTLTPATNFSSLVQFPLPAQSSPNQTDTNSLTVTLAGTNVPASTPFAIYGSLVSQAAPTNDGGNNSGATDVSAVGIPSASGSVAVLSPPPPCQPTTSNFTKCIVWKIDVNTSALPAGTGLYTKFDGPANPVSPPVGVTAGIDNGTHVFLDEHYDVTSAVGSFDPTGGTCTGTFCKTGTSVWSLQEIQGTGFTSGSGGTSGCFYIIAGKNVPAGGSTTVKSNRSTVPIQFFCPGVPTFAFQTTMNNPPGPPLISILQSGTSTGGVKSAPVPIQLTTTNAKAPYRLTFSDSPPDYTFQWTPQVGTFDVCTFDPTNTIQSFCATLIVSP